MGYKRLDLASWLLRVMAWDGLLPVAVVLAPMAIRLLFPRSRGATELVAIFLPVIAFIVRYVVGKRCISANSCTPSFQQIQFLLFVLAISALVLIESLVIIALHLAANPAIIFGDVGWWVFGVLLSIYLVSVVIAMYPGARTRYEIREPLP